MYKPLLSLHISSTISAHFPLRNSARRMPRAFGRFIAHVSSKKRRHRGDSLENSIAFDGLALLPIPPSDAASVWARVTEKSDGYTGKFDDVSDKSSIESFSTMATMDNNPGTGRIMDIYIYQYFGKRVEKWINRMKLPYLPPETILQHIIEMFSSNGIDMLEDLRQYPTDSSVELISDLPFGSDIVYGLNTIIRRAK